MSPLMNALYGLSRTTAYLATLALLVLAVITAAEVISRYFFNAPIIWVSDTSRYLLSAGVFLALPEVTHRRGHPTMSLVTDALPDWFRHPYMRVLLVIATLACLAVAYFTIGVVMTQFARATLTPGVVQIPRWILTVVMVYGLTLTAIFFLSHALAGQKEP